MNATCLHESALWLLLLHILWILLYMLWAMCNYIYKHLFTFCCVICVTLQTVLTYNCSKTSLHFFHLKKSREHGFSAKYLTHQVFEIGETAPIYILSACCLFLGCFIAKENLKGQFSLKLEVSQKNWNNCQWKHPPFGIYSRLTMLVRNFQLYSSWLFGVVSVT